MAVRHGYLLNEFGFDVVDLGPLSESWRVEPSTPDWLASRTRIELATTLHEQTRPAR